MPNGIHDDNDRKETSPRVSTIASKYVGKSGLWLLDRIEKEGAANVMAEVSSIAASALGQDETKGQG